VRKTLNCETTDRPPLGDNLRNDAVIEYVTGEKLTIERGRELCIKAMSKILDVTKQFMRFPQEKKVIVTQNLPSVYFSPVPGGLPDEEGYKIYQDRWTWWYVDEREYNRYETIGGIDKFSFFMCDEPKLTSEYLEVLFQQNIDRIKHLPPNFRPEAVFVAEDIAFKTGTIFHPNFLRREFFPRLESIVEAYHERGIKVIFHSDGNLWEIMDDLVDCGIDALNPIETAAGMDVGKLRKKYPKLVLWGGIDGSRLLSKGMPMEVRKVVRENIKVAKYGYIVGSSTEEIHNNIPLENALAMFEEVLQCKI